MDPLVKTVLNIFAPIFVAIIVFVLRSFANRILSLEKSRDGFVRQDDCLRNKNEHGSEHKRLENRFCEKIKGLEQNLKIYIDKDSERTEEVKKERHEYYQNTMAKLSKTQDRMLGTIEMFLERIVTLENKK